VLSSAIGHLLELTVPEEYEVKRGKWSFAHLPVIPPHFALAPIEKTEDRLKLLTRLIKRKDVTGLINACDAGREGELIFSFIVQHSRQHQAGARLWLQSMTQTAIRTVSPSLRDAAEVAGLRTAAVCRAESDWLMGINGTRAMTAFNSKTGGFHLTTVGRVQTPTLAIVVEREERIRKFVSRDYWELEARFGCGWANTPGAGSTRNSRKSRMTNTPPPFGCGTSPAPRPSAKPAWASRRRSGGDQALDPAVAPALRPHQPATGSQRPLRLLGQDHPGPGPGPVREAQGPDLPANRRPRLPEDYLDTVKEVLGNLPEDYAAFGQTILKQNWVKPNKRIFNNTKISDHFAIIPTGTPPKSLSTRSSRSSTTWSPGVSWRCSIRRRIRHHHPHHPCRG
jgi:DNA topoisomerase-3